MPYIVTDACIACGACSVICPQNAIIENEISTPFYRIIDECNACGRCQDICPAQAIIEDN